jgi:hypothetical protein
MNPASVPLLPPSASGAAISKDPLADGEAQGQHVQTHDLLSKTKLYIYIRNNYAISSHPPAQVSASEQLSSTIDFMPR